MTCEYCQKKRGTYNMNNICCRVRYLKSEISNDRRRSVREYWKKKMEPAAYDELMAAIRREKW